MAKLAPIVLREENDETLRFTITADDPTDDMMLIDFLELYLKTSNCQSDADAELLLSSTNTSQIQVLSQTSAEITGEAFIPGTALQRPYDRFWHLDAITDEGERKTALYGPVKVINL